MGYVVGKPVIKYWQHLTVISAENFKACISDSWCSKHHPAIGPILGIRVRLHHADEVGVALAAAAHVVDADARRGVGLVHLVVALDLVRYRLVEEAVVLRLPLHVPPHLFLVARVDAPLDGPCYSGLSVPHLPFRQVDLVGIAEVDLGRVVEEVDVDEERGFEGEGIPTALTVGHEEVIKLSVLIMSLPTLYRFMLLFRRLRWSISRN